MAEILKEKLIEWRRTLHKYPEILWTEFVTSYYIYKNLKEMGWSVKIGRQVTDEKVRTSLPDAQIIAEAEKRAIEAGVPQEIMEHMQGGVTGVIAEKTFGAEKMFGIPSPIIALRCDIDALALDESENSDHFPRKHGFASENAGKMHGCGHDGHSAIGLGVAYLLDKAAEEDESLCGTVRLIFQPAEEGCAGAYPMVKAGAVKDVDTLLGFHLGIKANKTGEIYGSTEDILATKKFNIEFIGKAAHAGINPKEGNNALLAAALVITEMMHDHDFNIGKSRFNIGMARGGSARNIIPDYANLTCEIRGEHIDDCEEIFEVLKESIRKANEFCGTKEIMIEEGFGYHAQNDERLAQEIVEAAKKIPEVTKAKTLQPHFGGSEDYTVMMDEVTRNGGRAVLINIGSNLAAGHHKNNFDFDEESLVIGSKVIAQAICDILKK